MVTVCLLMTMEVCWAYIIGQSIGSKNLEL